MTLSYLRNPLWKGIWGRLHMILTYIINLFLKFHFPINILHNSLQTQGFSFQVIFLGEFHRDNFFLQYNITWPNFIRDWVYFPSYSEKRISWFMIRYCMASWNIKFLSSKILISHKFKNFFSSFTSSVDFLDLSKIAKNRVDIAFYKKIIIIMRELKSTIHENFPDFNQKYYKYS